jgi:hypothetical protein
MPRRVLGPNGVVPSDGQHFQSVQILPGKGIALSQMGFCTWHRQQMPSIHMSNEETMNNLINAMQTHNYMPFIYSID